MNGPRHPFETLFAQLTQAMSPAGSPAVVHDLGVQDDAQHTQTDRFAWIPSALDTANRKFALTGAVSQTDQAVDFDVSIYGSSYWRVLELHSLLLTWLDILIGPEEGAAPSGDPTTAALVGVVDLASLIYPLADLEGLTLDFTQPFARSISFPVSTLANEQAIVDAANVQLNALPLDVHACLANGAAGELYFKLYCPTDPLAHAAPTVALNPATVTSACATLGFSSIEGNLTATGALPPYPYRPGYRVAKSQPGPRGGDAASSGWGVVVPVRLYQPIKSLQYLTGTTQVVPLTAAATGGDGADNELVNPGS